MKVRLSEKRKEQILLKANTKQVKTLEKSNEVKEATESKVSSRINSKTDTSIRSDQDMDPSDKQQSTKTTKKRWVDILT